VTAEVLETEGGLAKLKVSMPLSFRRPVVLALHV
jgi:hypothetical protein